MLCMICTYRNKYVCVWVCIYACEHLGSNRITRYRYVITHIVKSNEIIKIHFGEKAIKKNTFFMFQLQAALYVVYEESYPKPIINFVSITNCLNFDNSYVFISE